MDAGPTGAPYGSDLRLYANAGIPTLQLGPGDLATAHSADEYVPLADLSTVPGHMRCSPCGWAAETWTI